MWKWCADESCHQAARYSSAPIPTHHQRAALTINSKLSMERNLYTYTQQTSHINCPPREAATCSRPMGSHKTDGPSSGPCRRAIRRAAFAAIAAAAAAAMAAARREAATYRRPPPPPPSSPSTSAASDRRSTTKVGHRVVGDATTTTARRRHHASRLAMTNELYNFAQIFYHRFTTAHESL